MKYLVLSLCLFGTIAAAHADADCSAYIAGQVAQQAQMDFPNMSLYVNAPDTADAGQSVLDYKVTVVDNSDDRRRVFATYSVTIDETCHIMSAPQLVR